MSQQRPAIGSGHAFVVPSNEWDPVARVARARAELRTVDRRLYSLMVVPVSAIGEE